MNENGSGETQGVVEEQKDSHGRRGTIILDQYQPESPAESIVATQLDEIVVALGEERGSQSKTSGTPQKTGVFPTQSQRASELAQAMQGGIHQSNAQ